MNRLEFIFKAVNVIASKKHEATTEYMSGKAKQNIDPAQREFSDRSWAVTVH